MAIESRIRELSSRHEKLDRTIQDEMRRPLQDPARLSTLKRQKLRLKEEIHSMQASH